MDFDFLYGEDGATFSSTVLEAAPMLVRLAISTKKGSVLSGGALLSLSAAMCHGALQKLEELDIRNCMRDGRDVGNFMDALKTSGCARRLEYLCLDDCGIVVDGIRAFADLLGEEGFPALKELDLSSIVFEPGHCGRGC